MVIDLVGCVPCHACDFPFLGERGRIGPKLVQVRGHKSVGLTISWEGVRV